MWVLRIHVPSRVILDKLCCIRIFLGAYIQYIHGNMTRCPGIHQMVRYFEACICLWFGWYACYNLVYVYLGLNSFLRLVCRGTSSQATKTFKVREGVGPARGLPISATALLLHSKGSNPLPHLLVGGGGENHNTRTVSLPPRLPLFVSFTWPRGFGPISCDFGRQRIEPSSAVKVELQITCCSVRV